jgi:hypothetical protein
MDNEHKHENLSRFYTWGLPLLGLMGVLVVIGVVATLLVNHFM